MLDIRGDIEGEPMAGDPSGDPDANGRQFLAPHPHASSSLRALRSDAESGGRSDENFFEVTHVTVHVAPVGFEVEDRVAHQLAWAVIGHIAATSDVEHLDALLREVSRWSQHMIPILTAPYTHRDHRRMFQEQQLIGHFVGLPGRHQLFLGLEGAAIGKSGEGLDVENRLGGQG